MTPTPPKHQTSAKDDVKQAAASATEDLKSGARDMADTVSAEASNYASQAKSTAADEVKDIASALRSAAEELRRGSPQERTFSQIADGLADASDAVRGKDLSEIVSDVNGFARRNPLMFLGSAALVGFAATRFAKASSAAQDRSVQNDTDTTAGYRPETIRSEARSGTTPATSHVNTGGKS